MSQFIRLSLLTLLLFTSLLAPVGIHAQEATAAPEATDTRLVYNVPAQGEITDQSFSQLWTLETASPDKITIRVERLEGNLIPDLRLLDANGREMARGRGINDTYDRAEIADYGLPASGTFQVLVSRDRGEAGRTIGSYTLTVQPVATADSNPNNTVVVGELTLGTPVSGEITPARWYQRYSFVAQGKDTIQAVARRTSGGLFPEIEILDVNGSSIQRGYTSNSGDEARIERYNLPGSGTYTIAVTRQGGFRGYSTGAYELVVNLIGAGPDNPILLGAAGELSYGADISGELNARWYQDWTLNTTAGDTIRLSVQRTGGNVLPEIILLGGSGQELTRSRTDVTGLASTIERARLKGPGLYTVRVLRAGGQTGWTAGTYTLRATLIGSGEDNPALKTPLGVIEKGTPVQGTITPEQWTQVWTFEGQAKEVIDIALQRTDGNLVPRLDIRDANGQPLSAARAADTLDVATIQRYSLPGTGVYQVVVWRDGGQDGYTTGGYTLVVRPTGT